MSKHEACACFFMSIKTCYHCLDKFISLFRGPTNATLKDLVKENGAKMNASGLTKGDYVFLVEVEDEAKLMSNDTVKVSVVQSKGN